jgi:hypothetical protein
MQKWEHRVVMTAGFGNGRLEENEPGLWRVGLNNFAAALNEMGQEGWEVVGGGGEAVLLVAYLKRPIN